MNALMAQAADRVLRTGESCGRQLAQEHQGAYAWRCCGCARTP
jgi:hypothetical protein